MINAFVLYRYWQLAVSIQALTYSTSVHMCCCNLYESQIIIIHKGLYFILFQWVAREQQNTHIIILPIIISIHISLLSRSLKIFFIYTTNIFSPRPTRKSFAINTMQMNTHKSSTIMEQKKNKTLQPGRRWTVGTVPDSNKTATIHALIESRAVPATSAAYKNSNWANSRQQQQPQR